MHQKIDWQLADNNTILVDLKDVYCKYERDKYIEFIEADITNYIDLEKRKYKRTSNEYTMEIDFLDNVCKFTFPTQGDCSFDCLATLDIKDKNIILKYKIADEEKIITIIMKEENI